MDRSTEHLKDMTPLQRAVFALKETQARLEALERKQREPIAIVGMACRFPGGAVDSDSFWKLLCDGVDVIDEIPLDRWNAEDFFDSDPAAPGKMNSRWGGFLDRIDEFDNHFFAISDREAIRMDPQQRILLELTWEALEDAGLPPSTLRGTKVGVFVGIAISEYGMQLSRDYQQSDAYVSTGNSLCIAANRLSFALGVQGPSLVLDTACTSSLVALHLACQAIRRGECNGALVGGSQVILTPTGTMNVCKAGFIAPDGRVRAFDAAADGYVRSEGVGMVMLKPLSAALQDRDPIHAIIRGSAVNQNSSSNGLTAPSRAAQEQVLREAYRQSRVLPGQVRFIESQGTGTRLGDTIEALALGNVLGQDRAQGSPCLLGALKTNLGHMEAASGIASIIKTALALKHGQVPPNLHFQTPNPDIPFDTLQLRVPLRLTTWPDAPHPRIAGVNAFGFGGSNAHVVLEEPTVSPNDASTADASGTGPRCLRLLPLSACTDQALHELVERYNRFLRDDPPAWADICHTAAARRDHYDCRLAVLADSPEQAADRLEDFGRQRSYSGIFVGRKPFGGDLKVAFLYDDDTECWRAVASRVAESAVGFARAAEPVDSACQQVMGWSLATIGNKDFRWNNPAWAQPALLTLQLMLTAWWRRVGIVPDAVAGKGVGELAAAVTAGILTTEEALRLIVAGHSGNDTSTYNRVKPQPASLPFASAVDGKVHPGHNLDAAHWRSCMVDSHDITCALAGLADRHMAVGLVMGSGLPIDSNQPSYVPHNAFASFTPSLSLAADDGGVGLLTAIGTLYTAGSDLKWERLTASSGGCVRVPTYPWQRQRLWALNRNSITPSVTETPAIAEQPRTPHGDANMVSPADVRNRPDLNAPYVAPRTKLEADMLHAWTEVLRIDGIGIHDNFFELGGDSLQATMLLNRLEEYLGRAIPGQVLFRLQTINDLADYIRQNYPDAVRRLHPEEGNVLIDELAVQRDLPNGRDPVSVPDPAPLSAENAAYLIQPVARDPQADELLSHLDELSDDEVELLLRQEEEKETTRE
jgi:acyl transferase domain-containing protein